jgi:predicted N-acyltransferase
MPVPTYSAHHIVHPGLSRAVGEYLVREREAVAEQIETLAEYGPFRKSP